MDTNQLLGAGMIEQYYGLLKFPLGCLAQTWDHTKMRRHSLGFVIILINNYSMVLCSQKIESEK